MAITMTNPIADIFLFGLGSHARVVLEIVGFVAPLKRLCFVVREVSDSQTWIQGLRDAVVVTQEDFEAMSFGNQPPRFHVAVGSNSTRARLAQIASAKGLVPMSLISPSATVSDQSVLGRGVFLGPNSHVGPGSTVGDFSIINTGANLEHDSTIGRYSHLAPGSCVCGNAKVGEGSLVGANSVIKEGACLGPWSTLGALSFLNFQHQGIQETLVGAPAQLIEKRK